MRGKYGGMLSGDSNSVVVNLFLRDDRFQAGGDKMWLEVIKCFVLVSIWSACVKQTCL